MGRRMVLVLPGDGIGPEVIPEAVRVLRAADESLGLNLEIRQCLIGQAALEATGRLLPIDTFLLAKQADALLVGPLGGARWEHTAVRLHPRQAMIKLRSLLRTFATIWPIKSYPYLATLSPLKQEARALDVFLVYDNSAGLLYGVPRSIEPHDGGQIATNTLSYTAKEIERVARVAFEAAMTRKRRLSSIDQSKLLETGMLWRDVVTGVARDYPGVQFQSIDADHFFYELSRQPEGFDVVLADSVLGELIGTTAEGLTGTYAIHPKGYLGTGPGIFQPSHGAASDIAGRGTADPIGAIRAAGLLLQYGLGEREAADLVERAVEEVLKENYVPAEIDPEVALPTDEVGRAIALTLRRLAREGQGGSMVASAVVPPPPGGTP